MRTPMPTVTDELVTAITRLKLGRILDTLPERLVLAEKQDMTLQDLLLLILSDEISRPAKGACEWDIALNVAPGTSDLVIDALRFL